MDLKFKIWQHYRKFYGGFNLRRNNINFEIQNT